MPSHSPLANPGVLESLASTALVEDGATGMQRPPAPAVAVWPMVLAGGFSLAAFIALSVSPYTNESVMTVSRSHGISLLMAELFWLSAAALGASFAMLLQASGSAMTGNPDARDGRNVWMGYFTAVMAGFILVALVPTAALEAFTGLTQPFLAALGAFFASMVFRFLPGGRTPLPGDGSANATRER
jgi:hypothetical protein